MRNTIPKVLEPEEETLSDLDRQLLVTLHHWTHLSDEEWENRDSDPLTAEAASNAERLIRSLAISRFARVHRPGMTITSSRDGGIGLVVSTPAKNLEFAIDPDGEVSAVIIAKGDQDPRQKYTDIAVVDMDTIADDVSTLLA